MIKAHVAARKISYKLQSMAYKAKSTSKMTKTSIWSLLTKFVQDSPGSEQIENNIKEHFKDLEIENLNDFSLKYNNKQEEFVSNIFEKLQNTDQQKSKLYNSILCKLYSSIISVIYQIIIPVDFVTQQQVIVMRFFIYFL